MRLIRPLLVSLWLAASAVALSKTDKEEQIRREQDELKEEERQVEEEKRAERMRPAGVMKTAPEPLEYRPRVLTKESILEEHDEIYDGEKRHPGVPTLAYITPWNNKGYDRAVATAAKFTHIAPVWLQFKAADAEQCEVKGTHDIDHGWMERLREANPKIKIVPRLIFEDWNPEQFKRFVSDESWSLRCIRSIDEFLQRNKFDGLVLEAWLTMLMMARSNGDILRYSHETFVEWGHDLHSRNMQLILPIPPPVDGNGQHSLAHFNPEYWDHLAEAVDYIQIMTHDYYPLNEGERHFPQAPLHWVEQNILAVIGRNGEYAKKVLVGANHYGMKTDYKNRKQGAINADAYIELLEDPDAELDWDHVNNEHLVRIGKDSETYFPSLTFLEQRYGLARSYGAGISIWDLGQGLNYFSRLI